MSTPNPSRRKKTNSFPKQSSSSKQALQGKQYKPKPPSTQKSAQVRDNTNEDVSLGGVVQKAEKKIHFRPYKSTPFQKRAERSTEENEAFLNYKLSKIEEYDEADIKEELNARKLSYKPKTRDKEGKLQDNSLMPLNKYLAHAGICSRRDAVALIQTGKIKVNQQQTIEPGYKVRVGIDKVSFENKHIYIRKTFVYILLNKPKDYLTTSSDPQERKTVLDLVKHASPERIYPVGRLDRNTTGVLLLTNDGELTQKLTHPKYEIKKIYHVTLDKNLTKKDFEALCTGIELEDGSVRADALSFIEGKAKSEVGIEIHSGRNRIVRRMFAHLGYEVIGLDRVLFGSLSKKNVNRGKWRFLSEKEVTQLKYLNQSKAKASKIEHISTKQ